MSKQTKAFYKWRDNYIERVLKMSDAELHEEQRYLNDHLENFRKGSGSWSVFDATALMIVNGQITVREVGVDVNEEALNGAD